MKAPFNRSNTSRSDCPRGKKYYVKRYHDHAGLTSKSLNSYSLLLKPTGTSGLRRTVGIAG